MRDVTMAAALTALIFIAGSCFTVEQSKRRDAGAPSRAWSRGDPSRIKSFTLDNGMQVIFLPIPSDGVTVMVWYKVGAADDPIGQTGLAHAVEHATFRGLEAKTQQGRMRSVTPDDIEAEAFTAYDYTVYYHVVPTDCLEAVMRTEADRMGNLILTNETLISERDEIRAEWREEMTGQLETRFNERLRALLYDSHPYGRPVLGWPDDMRRLTAGHVNQFYRAWYAPNNAILIVVGAIPLSQLRPLAQRYYGNLPAHPLPERHRLNAPEQQRAQRLIMKDARARAPLWKRMYRAPSYLAGETTHVYALQVLVEILAEAPMGRLYRLLVATQKLATDISVEYLPDSVDVTDLSVYATPAPDVQVETLERVIDKALEAIITQGVSQTEMLRAQRTLQAQTPFAYQDGYEVAETLGAALTTGRTLTDIEQWEKRIAAVTQSQIQAAAQAILRVERSVTGILLPVSGRDDAGD